MRTYEEIEAASRPGAAFSNGTEWECWKDQWCARCAHDLDIDSGGCPIVMFALVAEGTPSEWVPGPTSREGYPSLGQRYRCVEFREADYA